MRNRWDSEVVYITSTIFIVVLWHIVGVVTTWVNPQITFIDTAIIEPGTGAHPLFWLPLEKNVIETTFAVFFLLWARRVKACACTKTITKLYLGLAAVSLVQTLTGFNYTLYAVMFMGLSATIVVTEAHFVIKRLKHERMVRRTVAGT